MRDYLLAIGLMTGNSLDGVDSVLSCFDLAGNIEDICSFSKEMPAELRTRLTEVRRAVNECHGEMEKFEKSFNSSSEYSFNEVQHDYTLFIHEAVTGLIDRAGSSGSGFKITGPGSIDVIGSHGQTCAHLPPSVAGASDRNSIYTVQIGDGQQLADLSGITVVCDFRSDDLMNMGEAAPLAPVHHSHLADATRKRGHFPIAFCNAGNTGNISVISRRKTSGELAVVGWDAGPFNNFVDKLMLHEKGLTMDKDGEISRQGKINISLLEALFYKAVCRGDGSNFLLLPPPRSSDPQWYLMIPELLGEVKCGKNQVPFVDRVRTATYFSSYILAFSLALLSSDIELPSYYALCGGGWKNPLSKKDFSNLLNGNIDAAPVLPEHKGYFESIRARLGISNALTVEHSNFFGFDGTAMEARIFADAAVCRIKDEPFSTPQTTNSAIPTVAGVIRFPQKDIRNATESLKGWLTKYNSLNSTIDDPQAFDSRWSRATAGWNKKLHSNLRTHKNFVADRVASLT